MQLQNPPFNVVQLKVQSMMTYKCVHIEQLLSNFLESYACIHRPGLILAKSHEFCFTFFWQEMSGYTGITLPVLTQRVTTIATLWSTTLRFGLPLWPTSSVPSLVFVCAVLPSVLLQVHQHSKHDTTQTGQTEGGKQLSFHTMLCYILTSRRAVKYKLVNGSRRTRRPRPSFSFTKIILI